MNKIYFFLLIYLIFGAVNATAAVSSDPDSDREFKIEERQYRVEMIRKGTQTDVYLRGAEEKNLSRDFPGENLFPAVGIKGNHYVITWNNYRDYITTLCFYDSREQKSRHAALNGFYFISRPEVIFKGDLPWLFIFKGNNSDNDDLFLYELQTGKVLNLTHTPGNEKIFALTPDHDQVTIDTETLYIRYRYRLDINSFECVLLEKTVIRWDPEKITVSWDATTLNTIIAFGDSITAGIMRMFDLEGEVHPELAYLAKVQEKLEEYGETYTINLGEPATNTYEAVARMDTALEGNIGFFFLILYGTNDVGWNLFSPASSKENLRWICLNAMNRYGMYPIISTVPPQELWEIGVQVFKENTELLNAGILDMAYDLGIPVIDSYTAFFESDEGWVACLEDIKGNHPSPLGHEIMAELFKPKILEVSPADPSNISVVENNGNRITVGWSENIEFDFEKYTIEFGYSPSSFDHSADSDFNGFTFLNWPVDSHINSNIYFRVQAVDKVGNTSNFTPVFHIQFNQ